MRSETDPRLFPQGHDCDGIDPRRYYWKLLGEDCADAFLLSAAVSPAPPIAKSGTCDFAPRLDALHNALDQAVCDAYGCPHNISDEEEAMLARLLALNTEWERRAGSLTRGLLQEKDGV